MDNQKKKIGLALSGGSVLGAAHIGVLKALEEFEIKIDFFAGTSIGGLVAGLYAFGKSWEEIKEFADELNWLEISSLSLSNFGLLSNEKLGDKFIDAVGNVNFEDAKIPFAVIAVDISSGEKKIFNKGNVAQALMATSAIPGIFIPVEIDGKLYVDGGVLENVPISAARELGSEKIIAVDLNVKRKYEKPENLIDLVVNSFNMMVINAEQMLSQKADILITPDLSNYDYVHTDKIDELVEAGYKEALKALKKNLD